MATNLTLMQQFLTLFNHILAKWHSFAHSALGSTALPQGGVSKAILDTLIVLDACSLSEFDESFFHF